MNVTNENTEVEVIVGSHPKGFSNARITEMMIPEGTLHYIPGGIMQVYPNLKSLKVQAVNLKKLTRSSFKELKSLETFHLYFNPLEVFHEDTFSDLPNLTDVNIWGSWYQGFEENLFQNNARLKNVEFSNNRLENLPKDFFQNNELLEVINLNFNELKAIDENVFEKNPNLREVYLNGNQLEFLPGDLFKNNDLLEVVAVGYNKLQAILIDFRHFKRIIDIDFSWNTCIDFKTRSRADVPQLQDVLFRECRL